MHWTPIVFALPRHPFTHLVRTRNLHNNNISPATRRSWRRKFQFGTVVQWCQKTTFVLLLLTSYYLMSTNGPSQIPWYYHHNLIKKESRRAKYSHFTLCDGLFSQTCEICDLRFYLAKFLQTFFYQLSAYIFTYNYKESWGNKKAEMEQVVRKSPWPGDRSSSDHRQVHHFYVYFLHSTRAPWAEGPSRICIYLQNLAQCSQIRWCQINVYWIHK